MSDEVIRPRFFKTASAFGAWLGRNHHKTELYAGFYKKGSEKVAMTYLEAVDEALCWGWIDGIVHRVNDSSYMHRFTPRKAKSNWSRVNVAKAEALLKAGRMQPPGIAHFKAKTKERTGIYAYELGEAKLAVREEARFKRDRKGWAWFLRQPTSYQKVAIHWVGRAKRAETREQRLGQLIEHSRLEKRLRQFTPLHLRDR